MRLTPSPCALALLAVLVMAPGLPARAFDSEPCNALVKQIIAVGAATPKRTILGSRHRTGLDSR